MERTMQTVSSVPGNIKLMTVVSITGWFIMSISLSNINKWIFQNGPFSYPIFLTTLHLFSTLLFCGIFFRFTAMGQSIKQDFDQKQVSQNASWNILLLSFVFTVSIACGNIAMRFLYISFLKMIFAMTPLATLILSRFLLDQSVDVVMYLSVVPICVGCMMCTIGEINFNIIGFLAALLATFLRALRSVLQGVLLKEDRIDSLSLLYKMSFPSFLQLLAATVFFEPSIFKDDNLYTSPSTWILIFMSCFCAVCYNIMTFLVTFYTSPVTLQVLGNVSMVLTVGLSLLIFQNEVSWVSLMGILFVVTGTWIYQKADKVMKFLVYFHILPHKESAKNSNH